MVKRIKLADLPNFDLADYLKADEDIAEYMSQVMAEDDPSELLYALGMVARARNMTQLAREVGMTREGLYKALSGTGNPSIATVMKVMKALGLRLNVTPSRVHA